MRSTDNPLESDIVLMDEASMVDLSLFRSLVSALSDDTKLIIIGDADQLPSVGAGNILRDLIASGTIPT
ncbi:AAA family ATPase, partial [Salmonella enterica]|uniref:AAA family ATPase n=1 Tax=Salmonella enterica TaxID=28901 RepID=UPI003D2BB701